ncbi:UNVERIFIED_CONTAM: hypothetical protein ITH36_25690 [Salmonella enterica subsp. enterica serovar Weltevreden]
MMVAKIIKEVKNETIIVSLESSSTAFSSKRKYRYPNFNVKNTELRSSRDPHALCWLSKPDS